MGFLLNLFKRLTMPTAASATAPAAGTATKVDADPSGGSFHVLMRIVRMAFDYPGLLAIGLVFIIGASLFQLFIPSTHRRRRGRRWRKSFTSPDADTDALRRSSHHNRPLPARLRGAAWSCSRSATCISARTSHSGSAIRLRMMYYEKLQRLSFAYHDRVHTGDLLTRGLLDIEGIRAFASRGLPACGLPRDLREHRHFL